MLHTSLSIIRYFYLVPNHTSVKNRKNIKMDYFVNSENQFENYLQNVGTIWKFVAQKGGCVKLPPPILLF